MNRTKFLLTTGALALCGPGIAIAGQVSSQPQAEVAQDRTSLREEVHKLRLIILNLEKRLTALEQARIPEVTTVTGPEAALTPAPAPVNFPSSPTTTQRLNIFNPQITLFGNFLARTDNKTVLNQDGDPVDDRFNLRELEFDARAAIDPYADGVAIITLESEVPNEFEVEVEEGYIVLKRLPFLHSAPGGLKLKFGRMRVPFGRLNMLHTHDLPQATRPLPLRTFLGEEGFIQNGVSADFFLPSTSKSVLEWTLQILDGGDLPVGEANRGEDLAYMSRLKWFHTFGAAADLEFGLSNYLGKNDLNGNQGTLLSGFDFLFKWKPMQQGEWRSFLLGGELLYASMEQAIGSNQTPFGYYTFAQFQMNSRWYAGLRYGFSDRLEDDGLDTRALTLYSSFYTSEFLRFRLGWETVRSDLPQLDGRSTGTLEVNFVFGSHPVEPYWVSR